MRYSILSRSVVAFGLFVFVGSLSLSAASPVRASGSDPQLLSEEFKFTEGPIADRQGNVYFTDQPNDRIMVWTVEGKLETFLQPSGRANGLYFDLQGNILACADEKNQLWQITPDKDVTVLIENIDGKLLNGPNDLWVDPNGGVFFTDPFYKRDYWNRSEKEIAKENVYYMPPNRSGVRIAAGDFVRPNGIVGTPDGKKIYVADINARKTYVFEIGANGELKNRQLFVEMGSDGMTMDGKGNLYLSGRGVTVFNPDGEKIDEIPIDEGWTANVCFGGRDRNILFVTAMDSLYAVRMKVRGTE
ncbi:SMP-30/gluconolactonase/LRE family protein [Verrucomicrobia bacterium]|jgi:gluconolactonase|nr:SMP-30/gluconolactonase/LRE family protein [Verrucomicrobiota bacterium]